jgi:hypothetical protein
MAQAARAALAASGRLAPAGERGALAVHVTDASRLVELAPRFLGEPLARFDQIDL